MTNYVNKWIVVKLEELRQSYGGKCSECDSILDLEFHHVKETGLSGRGRGRKERYYDIKNNPDSYTLLCEDCHKEKRIYGRDET